MDHVGLLIAMNKQDELASNVRENLDGVLESLEQAIRRQFSAPDVIELLERVETLRSLTHVPQKKSVENPGIAT
jgi:hypothetical protein